MSSLGRIAADLDVSDRTLRRAVNEGLLNGESRSAGPVTLTVGEERYVRRAWPLLGKLRAALRTEPAVACAVVFGSVARGDDAPGSDVDLLVSFRGRALGKRVDLEDRLAHATGLAVHVVELAEAERAPVLLDEIVRTGRPVVDRDRVWPHLLSRRSRIAVAAAKAEGELASRARSAVDEFLAAG